MSKKIAILSNVNMTPVVRLLKKSFDIYEPEGYGNELGIMINKSSGYNNFGAEITFLIMDLMELIGNNSKKDEIFNAIDSWIRDFENAIDAKTIYYISDAYLFLDQWDLFGEHELRLTVQNYWFNSICDMTRKYSNVRLFEYSRIIEKIGEANAYSRKMWYMGKIVLTTQAQAALAEKIKEVVRINSYTPKKVLLLDLDNTLWGGLAGENDITPIELSEEHKGLAYKNLQRVIKVMQNKGVVLGIVSKNNEEDALNIINKHPHMVLSEDDFAIKKINWTNKNENILEIAKELNLGIDSFVFFDDNETERELVKELLPEVCVPDFPSNPEELPKAMADIYNSFFAKPYITREDMDKTQSYAANVKRTELEKSVGSFEDYLKKLDMSMEKMDPEVNFERLVQLVNKTNQFNLITKRYTEGEMKEVLKDNSKQIYLYKVKDKFADNGIVAAVIVRKNKPLATIEDFVMSCRVMGKNIEDAIISEVENDLSKQGFENIEATYIKTKKNKPVENLYDRLGYDVIEKTEDGSRYSLQIKNKPERVYFVKM